MERPALEVALRSVAGPDGGICQDGALCDRSRGVFAVADGLGQHRGGAEASALVLAEVHAELAGEAPAALAKAVGRAAKALHARGLAERALASMATTLTLLRVDATGFDLAHVGDSRLYRLRGGDLAQLTRDHSVAWEQVEAGAITKSAARHHPNQRLLTRTLIARRDFAVPEVARHDLAPGDLLLLCTDGVTKPLDDEAVLRVLAPERDVEPRADALLAAVDAAGREDDTSFVIIRRPR